MTKSRAPDQEKSGTDHFEKSPILLPSPLHLPVSLSLWSPQYVSVLSSVPFSFGLGAPLLLCRGGGRQAGLEREKEVSGRIWGTRWAERVGGGFGGGVGGTRTMAMAAKDAPSVPEAGVKGPEPSPSLSCLRLTTRKVAYTPNPKTLHPTPRTVRPIPNLTPCDLHLELCALNSQL